MMTSEVEERLRLVTAGYDPHRSQRVNGTHQFDDDDSTDDSSFLFSFDRRVWDNIDPKTQ